MSIHFEAECDGCRAAFLKIPGTDLTAALAYMTELRSPWSVVATAGFTQVLCPRCSRHRTEPLK